MGFPYGLVLTCFFSTRARRHLPTHESLNFQSFDISHRIFLFLGLFRVPEVPLHLHFSSNHFSTIQRNSVNALIGKKKRA